MLITPCHSVLIVANAYPSVERPWKCPFNHRAVKAIEEFCNPSVISIRAWLPWRLPKSYLYDGVIVRELLVPPIMVTGLPSIPFISTIKQTIIDAFIILLSKQIKKQAQMVEMIHSISIGYHSFAAQQVANELDIPHVVQLIGSDVTCLAPDFAISEFFKRWVTQVRFFIANSQSLNDSFRRLTDQDILIETIYRGVNTKIFKPTNVYFPDHINGECRFLYLGGYINKKFDIPGPDPKGGDLILRAWQILDSKSAGRAKLILAGPWINSDGLNSFRDTLQHPQNVSCIGVLPAEMVSSTMQGADVVVIPSRTEGMPNVCLEAMASGLPVVAYAVGGLPEVIQSGINGLLVPPTDIRGLADQMLYLLNNPGIRRKMGQSARAIVEKNFDSQHYGLRLSNFYSNALSACTAL